MDELIGVPVVGQPVVYGAALVVLLVVVFTGDWGGSLVTVAHEGGHMLMAVLTFRGFQYFTMDDGDNAGTRRDNQTWGPGDFLTKLAGYFTPPLLGLGGAAVLVRGNVWAVLVGALVLVFAAFLYARGGLANLVTAIAAVVLILLLWRGAPMLQVAAAAAAVWLMLLGGVRSAVMMSRADSSDAHVLARRYLVPAVLWQVVWVGTALVCLYAGGRLLFIGTAWPAGLWPFDVRA
jgi:hypothetical protein